MKLNIANPGDQESEYPDLKVTITPNQEYYLIHQYAAMEFPL